MGGVRHALLIVGAAATIASACGGNGSSSPLGSPAAPSAPTVTAVAVSSLGLSPSSFQLKATASFANGSSKDVTSAARWESANPLVAIVSLAGLVTGLSAGDVELRATYQSVLGSTTLTIARPPGPSTFALTGSVLEVMPNAHALAGARVTITSGPDAGLTTTSDSSGAFRFPTLARGVIGVDASKDGYLLYRISNWMLDADKQLTVNLYPVPPTDTSGVTATARCGDGSWTWAKLRMLACAETSIAYVVCPGPLCPMPQ
jgi:carboxypeptidase family protein/Big-like domain-containing protein